MPCIPHVQLEEGKWYLQDLCLYAMNASVVEGIILSKSDKTVPSYILLVTCYGDKLINELYKVIDELYKVINEGSSGALNRVIEKMRGNESNIKKSKLKAKNWKQ